MARNTRQIVGGTVAVVVGSILGRVNVAHGSVHDVILAIAWIVYVPGYVLIMVGLVGYAGTQPLITSQPSRRHRARGWMAAFVVWTLLALTFVYAVAAGLVHRIEGDARPHLSGTLVGVAIVLVFAALARHALRRARTPRTRRRKKEPPPPPAPEGELAPVPK
jgi:Na+/melibiose symporter-like transporter